LIQAVAADLDGPMINIVSLSDRPEFSMLVARWGWEAWGRKSGRSFDTDLARTKALAAEAGFEKTFVLLESGAPVAMASLVREDLEDRPDLTPWLAGVYVEPEFRGRGYAVMVVREVETAAAAESVKTLWLYTRTAQGLYRKLGWEDFEEIERPSGRSIIMRKTLLPAP
jgi:predicted GNAT family acetyltransferase